MQILTCKRNGQTAWAMAFKPGMVVPKDGGPFTYHLEQCA